MKRLRVTLKHSVISRPSIQLEHIKGLGLRRIRHSRILANTPAIRGLVQKVLHLVHVEEIEING